MDLAHQEAILKVVQEKGKENVVVVLGSPDPESAELAAETVVNGDPTFAGPLAGVSLELPVYHILEPGGPTGGRSKSLPGCGRPDGGCLAGRGDLGGCSADPGGTT